MSAIAGSGPDAPMGEGRHEGAPERPLDVRNQVTGSGNTIVQIGAYTVRQEMSEQRTPRHEVPPPVGEFFNRDELLAQLDEAAVAPGMHVRILVLTGPPGIGRKTVSRHWVHSRLRDNPALPHGRPFAATFPGGEFYADLAAGRHVTTEEVLRQLLLGAGVDPDFVPATLEERSKLFRSRTAMRPVVLVIDGAREQGQVLGLLPGCPGSVVLVVPQEPDRLCDLDGARLLRLAPFDAATSMRLLAAACGPRRVTAEGDAVDRLVRLCGGLPLGVRLAARQLAARPELTVEALVRDWSPRGGGWMDGDAAAGDTVTGLDVVYDSLSAPVAEAYRRVGQIPGRAFDLGLAAAAVGRPADETLGLLRVLADNGLLEADVGGWWSPHELIAAHARARALASESLDERRALLGRLLRRLRDMAVLADRTLFPVAYRPHDRASLCGDRADPFASEPDEDGDGSSAKRSRDAALDWLDDHREVALACLGENERARCWDTEAWQLASAYTSLFLHRRRLAPWARTHELGADAARRVNAADAEAWLRCMRSRPLTDQRALDAAGAELARARLLAEDSANLALRASVAEFSGRHFDALGDTARAWQAFAACRQLNSEAAQPRGVALADYFEGRSRDAAGQHERAAELLDAACVAFTLLGDARMAARARLGLGVATARRGQRAEAVALLADAARALVELDALAYATEAHQRLAALAEDAGDPDLARSHWRQVLDIYLRAGDDLRADEARAQLESRWPGSSV